MTDQVKIVRTIALPNGKTLLVTRRDVLEKAPERDDRFIAQRQQFQNKVYS